MAEIQRTGELPANSAEADTRPCGPELPALQALPFLSDPSMRVRQLAGVFLAEAACGAGVALPEILPTLDRLGEDEGVAALGVYAVAGSEGGLPALFYLASSPSAVTRGLAVNWLQTYGQRLGVGGHLAASLDTNGLSNESAEQIDLMRRRKACGSYPSASPAVEAHLLNMYAVARSQLSPVAYRDACATVAGCVVNVYRHPSSEHDRPRILAEMCYLVGCRWAPAQRLALAVCRSLEDGDRRCIYPLLLALSNTPSRFHPSVTCELVREALQSIA